MADRDLDEIKARIDQLKKANDDDRLERLEASFQREAAQGATQWKKLGVITTGWNSGAEQGSSWKVGGYISAPGSRKRFDEVVQKAGHRLTLERLVRKPMYEELFPCRVLDKAQGRLDGTVAD